MLDDNREVILTEEEVNALIDRTVKAALKKPKPEPWDSKTERRVTERRKPGEPAKKRGKIGGLISVRE